MRILISAAVLLAVLGLGGPAYAQSATALESRVDRLEREMRAVQRKIFPGGAGATFEPEITAAAEPDAGGMPASSPIADLTQRVASLEGQVQTLTGQVEQGQYRLRQLEDAFNAYKRSTDARLKALEDNAASIDVPPAAVIDPPAAATTPRNNPRPATTTPATTPATAPPRPATGGTRAAQLAAIERPATGEAAEDGYLYGYRLWQAKLYPEARKALEEVVAKYPKHRRASFAQNLLGRAYLDAGAPSLAAVAFYENYKKNPAGERAPDSLYYLAQALVQLKKPTSEICKVYTELMQLYGERLSEEMKAGVAEGRTRNKCA
ncbi:MAG: tetratricopeptide repeat protein [Pseudomonadota bacterium]